MSRLSGVSKVLITSDFRSVSTRSPYRANRKPGYTPGFFSAAYTPLNTLKGECVTTLQVASNPLLPTNNIPRMGPDNQSRALK